MKPIPKNPRSGPGRALAAAAILTSAWLSMAPAPIRAQAEIEEAVVHHPAERLFNERMNQPSDPTEYERLIAQAEERIVFSDWSQAFKTLNKAIALDPAQPQAYLDYGRAHLARNEYPAAERAFLKTQEVDPDFAPGWYEYAKLMVIKGDLVIAFESANKAVVLSESKDWKSLKLLGELSGNRGDREGTEKAFDAAIAVLQARYDQMDRNITREELKEDIREIRHEVELVGDISGNLTEVPVTRIETERKIAPDEWREALRQLEARIDEVEARKAEVLAGMDG